jgi:hypothetical protein
MCRGPANPLSVGRKDDEMEQLVIDVYGALIDEAGEWLIGAIVVYWLGRLVHVWALAIWGK